MRSYQIFFCIIKFLKEFNHTHRITFWRETVKGLLGSVTRKPRSGSATRRRNRRVSHRVELERKDSLPTAIDLVGSQRGLDSPAYLRNVTGGGNRNYSFFFFPPGALPSYSCTSSPFLSLREVGERAFMFRLHARGRRAWAPWKSFERMRTASAVHTQWLFFAICSSRKIKIAHAWHALRQ